MGKIIQFPAHKRHDAQLHTMKAFADDLDQLMLHAILEQGLEAREVAGIVAHRLGTLMKSIDEKSELWGVCQKVVEKQAVID